MNRQSVDKPIKPAATVVVLRESNSALEVLLLRRNPELVFAPDCWVFPGGKVEQCDIDVDDSSLSSVNEITARRECLEETGLELNSGRLQAISHWTTPEIRVKRFATQFYISLLESAQDVQIDYSEIVEYQWLTADQALRMHHEKTLHIMPPTYVTLHEIARHKEYAAVCHYYQTRAPRKYNPKPIMSSKTIGTFLYQGDSGYETANPELKTNLNRCEYKDGLLEHFCTLD